MTDHLTIQVEWDKLCELSLSRELNRLELQRVIELTRVLRQTNTGPARKKKTVKGEVSDDQLNALLKG